MTQREMRKAMLDRWKNRVELMYKYTFADNDDFAERSRERASEIESLYCDMFDSALFFSTDYVKKVIIFYECGVVIEERALPNC